MNFEINLSKFKVNTSGIVIIHSDWDALWVHLNGYMGVQRCGVDDSIIKIKLTYACWLWIGKSSILHEIWVNACVNWNGSWWHRLWWYRRRRTWIITSPSQSKAKNNSNHQNSNNANYLPLMSLYPIHHSNMLDLIVALIILMIKIGSFRLLILTSSFWIIKIRCFSWNKRHLLIYFLEN